jgi:hemolysin type calcium-binding protein
VTALTVDGGNLVGRAGADDIIGAAGTDVCRGGSGRDHADACKFHHRHPLTLGRGPRNWFGVIEGCAYIHPHG